MSKYLTFECGCRFEVEDDRGLNLNEGLGDARTMTKLPRIKYNPYDIREDCPATWKLFEEGNTRGVFQLETPLGKSWSNRLKPANIEELAALSAALRPGALHSLSGNPPKSMTARFVDRKHGDEEIEDLHPALREVLKETYGCLLYQEQAMNISKVIAGFDLQQADILRKCIARGSFVDTNHGLIKIEDLVGKCENGKYEILTMDDDCKLVRRKIKKVWYSGYQEVFRITTHDNKSIMLTYKHEILTSKGWMQLRDIGIYSLIVTQGKHVANHSYVTKIEYVGKESTYDFEVEGDSHFGFINGICVHNSIGKKDSKLMSEVETMFLEGCDKVGIVSEKEAREIFDWIRESQKYSFNKSHAVSYAKTGYMCAYTKAHFPIVFFGAYLKGAHWKNQKKEEEIYDFVQESRMNGFEVYPPKIHTGKVYNRFHVKDEGDFTGIYAGIADVKGVGQSSVASIETAINKAEEEIGPISEWTWVDYLIYCSDNISIDVTRNLILAGVFDFFEVDRKRMLYEIDSWNTLTNKEKEWSRQFEVGTFQNIIELFERVYPVKKEGGGCHNKNRSEKVYSQLHLLKNPPNSLQDTPDWLSFKERQMFGIPLTANSTDVSSESMEATHNCRDFINGLGDDYVVIAATVDRVKVVTTKNGKTAGSKMAFIDISDNTGVMSITLFPMQWAEFSTFFTKDNILLIVGHRDNSYKKNSFVVDKVKQL